VELKTNISETGSISIITVNPNDDVTATKTMAFNSVLTQLIKGDFIAPFTMKVSNLTKLTLLQK
jgi:hypothetical protein